jgi:hypothetical protein
MVAATRAPGIFAACSRISQSRNPYSFAMPLLSQPGARRASLATTTIG